MSPSNPEVGKPHEQDKSSGKGLADELRAIAPAGNTHDITEQDSELNKEVRSAANRPASEYHGGRIDRVAPIEASGLRSDDSTRDEVETHLETVYASQADFPGISKASKGQGETMTQPERLKVVEGLTKPESHTFGPGEPFRFLLHAPAQRSPREVGPFLFGRDGNFEKTDEPLNTSLIDQDHTWTFEGNNGFLIEPTDNPDDIISAHPNDAGVNDLSQQDIEFDADGLLAATSSQGYSHINIRAGRVAGVLIRKDRSGNELGDPIKNQQLRDFASDPAHPLTIVEVVVEPQELKAGPASFESKAAGQDMRMWKAKFPEDGALLEVDLARILTGEQPGFKTDEEGYVVRIRKLDEYGQTGGDVDDPAVLEHILHRVQAELIEPAKQQGEAPHEIVALERSTKDAIVDVRVDEAMLHYASYGEGYDRHQAVRLAQGGMETDTYLDGSLRVIASVNSEKFTRRGEIANDPAQMGLIEGKWTDGHDYAPDSFNNRYIAEQFVEFVGEQGAENVVVVYEGMPEEFSTWTSAVQARSESGSLQFLSRQMGVESVPGEPMNINEIIASEFEQRGMTREAIALAFSLRAMQAKPEVSFGGSGETDKAKRSVEDILMDLYPQLTGVGLAERYPVFDEAKKKQLTEDTPEAQADFLRERQGILAKLEPAIAPMNAWLEAMQITGRLEIDRANGELKLVPPLKMAELDADPHKKTRLGEFWADLGVIRDRELSRTVAKQVARGKKVFIAYGGSHVMSTKDVFEQLFGQSQAAFPRQGKMQTGMAFYTDVLGKYH